MNSHPKILQESSSFNPDTYIYNKNHQKTTTIENISTETGNYIQTPTWTVETRNIRGLVEDSKRNLWFNTWSDNKWDIIISTETNGNSQQTKFWNTSNYQCWWTTTDQNIGQGTGIALTTNLAKRVFKIHSYPGRIIALDLSFPNRRYMRIIGTYFPTGNATKIKNTTYTHLSKLITTVYNKEWLVIVAGGLNGVPNPSLDKQSTRPTPTNFKLTNSITNLLSELDFIDTFRESHPSSKQFTWANSKGNASRIDQIWISPNEHWNMLQAQIDPNTDSLIPSDHKATWCTLESWQLTIQSKINP